jgi:hypothetical protein
MSRQQLQLLSVAIGVAALIAFIIWRGVETGKVLQEKAIELDAEEEVRQRQIKMTLATHETKALLQRCQEGLRTITKSVTQLEEGQEKRIAQHKKGMPFPADVDESFRALREEILNLIRGLDETIEDYTNGKLDAQTTEELLKIRQQIATYRSTVQSTDFRSLPPK